MLLAMLRALSHAGHLPVSLRAPRSRSAPDGFGKGKQQRNK